MKISELAGENWPEKKKLYAKQDATTHELEVMLHWNEALDACDLTVVVDVEAMAKAIYEMQHAKYKWDDLPETAPWKFEYRRDMNALAQSAKQFIKITKGDY